MMVAPSVFVVVNERGGGVVYCEILCCVHLSRVKCFERGMKRLC
jgi:hypothetical protein